MVDNKTRIHNLQFEKSVLSVLMINTGAYEIASGSLSERCFYAERHKYIYNAIKLLVEQGKPCTESFIDGYLKNDWKTYQLMGGEEYLAELYCDAFSDAHNLEAYVAELNKLADHRDVEGIAKRMIEVANDVNIVDVYSSAESLFEKTDSSTGVKKTSFTAAESLLALQEKMLEKAQQVYDGDSCIGVRFGIRSLDDKIGSVEAGHFCIIAGREGSLIF